LDHYSPAAFVYILLIAVLIVVRNLRPRRIKVKSLWISPTVISVLSIYVLAVTPDPTPIWLRILAGLIGVVLGGAFGFFRGKVTSIRTEADMIYVDPSLAASLLWVVAFGLRYWVRMSTHQLPILTALTDALILFVPASYVVMYWMLYRKYERLKGPPLPGENAAAEIGDR
jgi:Protein of unknown function (DUF1453)